MELFNDPFPPDRENFFVCAWEGGQEGVDVTANNWLDAAEVERWTNERGVEVADAVMDNESFEFTRQASSMGHVGSCDL